MAKLGLYSTCFGHLSIYGVSIFQKTLVLSKCVSKWNAPAIEICQQLWQYHEKCTCHHFHLPVFPCGSRVTVIITGRSEFAAFYELYNSQTFLSSFTYELNRKIPFQTHKLPLLHYRMSQFCAKFYIRLNFDILGHFDNSGQRSIFHFIEVL
jgi:hypothetical protein